MKKENTIIDLNLWWHWLIILVGCTPLYLIWIEIMKLN